MSSACKWAVQNIKLSLFKIAITSIYLWLLSCSGAGGVWRLFFGGWGHTSMGAAQSAACLCVLCRKKEGEELSCTVPERPSPHLAFFVVPFMAVSRSGLSSGCKDALISLTDLGSRLMKGAGLHWACLQNPCLKLGVAVNQSKSSCGIAASPCCSDALWGTHQWEAELLEVPGLQAGSSSQWGGHVSDQQGFRADFLSERLKSYFQQWDYY